VVAYGGAYRATACPRSLGTWSSLATRGLTRPGRKSCAEVGGSPSRGRIDHDGVARSDVAMTGRSSGRCATWAGKRFSGSANPSRGSTSSTRPAKEPTPPPSPQNPVGHGLCADDPEGDGNAHSSVDGGAADGVDLADDGGLEAPSEDDLR